jgi:hypothetical protein
MARKKKEETEVLDIDDKTLVKKLFEEPEDIEVLDDESYYEDVEPNYYEDEEKEVKIKKPRNYNKLLSIIFTVAIAITIMIIIDVVCISRFDKGPFFALPLHTYNDGGTTEYYGFGYKVIDYHQEQGRRDKELGLWNLKYNSNAINIKDFDLAIDFYEDKANTYEKYYKKFVRIDTTLHEIDNENNTLLLGYKDNEGEKYTLNIKCKMVKKNLDKYTPGNEIMIIGTFTKYNEKTNTITISNCFAEQ